jgi:predicted TIM-barrel fold metal-dependent hydrolase
VLLTLEPWVPTERVGDAYVKDNAFYLLGSVDVHTTDVSRIESTIKSYIEAYGIIGLKLHPNLQNFKPQPSHNEPAIMERLKKVYETASKYKLYLLFHGGISIYTNNTHPKYGHVERSRANGLLRNFYNRDGTSEILGNYGVPIVIAHIGHYGIANPDYVSMKFITERYQDVLFDTSGVSASLIARALTIMPSSRLIFGSDALYNRIAYNVAFLYRAAKQCNNGEKYETILANVLGNNFHAKILKK